MLNVTKPDYFPLNNGRYEVKAGLYRFPCDFGQATLDQQVFQLDYEFSTYRAEKLKARAESLEKYYRCEGYSRATATAINQFIIQRLLHEHPQVFQLEKQRNKLLLHCQHSQEALVFNYDYELLDVLGKFPVMPNYQDGLDALAGQLQEDISVVSLDDTGRDRITALHLCFPNHWATEDKIGRGFTAVHAPVPGMEKINQNINPLLSTALHKGPYVRFAWGVATDNFLNHHPIPPQKTDRENWHGRAFDPQKPELFLRIERQILTGFPDHRCILFTIRTYFHDIKSLRSEPEKMKNLITALSSMNQASQNYKGLIKDCPAILTWLKDMEISA